MAPPGRKLRATVLALALAIIAVYASAGAAEAHDWTIEGKTLTALGISEESVSSTATGKLQFAFTFGGLENKWSCAMTISAAAIQAGGLDHETPALKECGWEGPGSCAIAPSGSPTPLSSEVIEVKSVLYDKLFPTKPETKNLFNFEMLGGAQCAYPPQSWPISGTLAARIEASGSKEVTFALSPTINANAGMKLMFGTLEARLTGGYISTLSGKHAGQLWGAV